MTTADFTPRRAALFDMDHTLLHCNSGALWIRYLRERGEITRLTMLRAMGWILRYKLAILDMETVTTRVIAQMAGDSEGEMRDKCRAFFERDIVHQVAPLGREALARHRAAGDVIAILSSSTPYVTEPLAELLGIEHVICTRLDIVDGKFAGTHVKPACYGAGKVVWAERFAALHNIDLARSVFYTDSYSDLPMLERVGEARVINPDARLARHARRLGWPVESW